MRPTLPALTLLLLPLAACEFGDSSEQLRGSGTTAVEERPVAGVRAVEMGVPGTLQVTQGEVESLRLEADDNFMEHLETTVAGGVLRIASPGVQLRPSAPLRAHLVVREIQRVAGTGAAVLELDGIEEEALELSLSGAGRVRGSGLEVRRLDLALSGAGRAELQGRAEELTVELSGAGDVRAEGLDAARVRVQLAGAGSAHVSASESLTGSVAGASSVTYRGDPVMEVSTAGASRVRRGSP